MKPFLRLFPSTLLIMLLGYAHLCGQLRMLDYNGYVKNLVTYSGDKIQDLPFEQGQFQNALQARLNLFLYPSQQFAISLQSRNILSYQKNIRFSNRFLQQFNTDTYYLDLRAEWKDQDDWYSFSEIDRLYLEWYGQSWSVTAGRQRITWATCLVWNPIDLFNPFYILDFDYEEHPGTDALRFQYYTGPLSQIGIAFSPGRKREDVIVAARFLTNRWYYDFNFLAGWQKNGLRLGMSWAGEIADGGFRGEILYSDPDLSYTVINLNAQSLTDLMINRQITDPYWTFAISYDYTFQNSFYIHSEYLYNGLGTIELAGDRRFDIPFTGELTPARHSVYHECAYNFTPLIRGSVFIIFNPNDHSWIAGPSVLYDVATNWELYMLIFPSGGDAGSEYGGYPAQYFVRMRYSF